MLRSLYLMPTQRCNGCCDYCYLADRTVDGDAERFHAVLSRFVRDARSSAVALSGLQLRFIGGEPCCRPDLLFELSRRFLTELSGSVVRINTNGTLFDEGLAARFAPFADRLALIVSLDGPPEIHNARRHLLSGADAFEAAARGIETALAHGIPAYVNAVLDGFSIDGLSALMELCRQRFGMSALGVSLLDSPRHPMTVEAKLDLLTRAYAMSAAQGFDLGGHHRLLLGELVPELRCQAGISTILVTAAGELVACQRFVGRTAASPPRFDELTDFATVRARECSSKCYTDDVRALARGLHALYERRYPEYLRARELDRILFGVI